MKGILSSTSTLLLLLLLGSCYHPRKLITDEVVLRGGNSQTGTILQTDSTQIRLKKMDESISIIPWSSVDTIRGKKLRTIWLGVNVAYHNTPYFSVFRNEAMTGRALGAQFKAGLAYRGTKLYYLHLSLIPAAPYSITKTGFGFQRYTGRSSYIRKNAFFVGGEANLMNAKFNNGAQVTLEPFTGYERKLKERLRIHFKLGLQFNLANKNSNTGINAGIGIHFLNRNFRKQYEYLNKEHRLYRK